MLDEGDGRRIIFVKYFRINSFLSRRVVFLFRAGRSLLRGRNSNIYPTFSTQALWPTETWDMSRIMMVSTPLRSATVSPRGCPCHLNAMHYKFGRVLLKSKR